MGLARMPVRSFSRRAVSLFTPCCLCGPRADPPQRLSFPRYRGDYCWDCARAVTEGRAAKVRDWTGLAGMPCWDGPRPCEGCGRLVGNLTDAFFARPWPSANLCAGCRS